MINFEHLVHLPHCRAHHVSLHHAIKFKLCTESLLSVPRSAVVDGIISYGGSTGIGFDLPRKAYGEFFERNHFFTRVVTHAKKELTKIGSPEFQRKLQGLCLNTDCDLFPKHTFSLTTVYNLFDGQPQDYFLNSISLNGSKEDAHYLKFSDSCGCACHPIKQKSIYCSLMEFLERQALLGSWLTKTCRYTINPQILRAITPYTSLVERLLDNGDIYIFEINNRLPGYTVLMFYFSHCAKDVVQYSVGSMVCSIW